MERETKATTVPNAADNKFNYFSLTMAMQSLDNVNDSYYLKRRNIMEIKGHRRFCQVLSLDYQIPR
jgi:hypothetical protein